MRVLKNSEICERALRKIGAFPTTESAARPEYLAEALLWLDMMIGHVTGTRDVYWLKPATLSLTLVGGTQTYDLRTALGSSFPVDGINFVTDATHDDGQGNRTSLDIVNRETFEAIPVPGETGTPDKVWIDRLRLGPTLKTHPVLGSGVTGHSIKLVTQTYSEDFTKDSGNRGNAMRATWNLWCVTELAGWIGNGPVRKLPRSEVDGIKSEARGLWTDIAAGENRERTSSHQTAFRDV